MMARLSLIILLGLMYPLLTFSQQNNTLFFMQNTPQANFVNPAVTNQCNLIIGLPVLSSVHLNTGNSGFSYNQANHVLTSGDAIMKRLAKVNYFETEFHTSLLFVGYWYKDNYLTFSINEKADLFTTYSRDMFSLAWKGNSQFEGKTAQLGHSGAFLNYRREYAIGIARETSSGLQWGARAKLLFGKLNTSFTKSRIGLYTDPVTFDLNFDMDWQANTSMPLTVKYTSQDTVSSIGYNGTIGGILFNRQNLGFAADLGFIKEIDDNITISGSALDLGFISWKSTPYNFTQNGRYTYHGPLGDNINEQGYIEDLTRVIQEDFGIRSTPKSYIAFLSPRFYLGGTYKIKDNLNVGLLGMSKVNRFKITSGATLSLNKEFSDKFSASLSYSYLFRSLTNVGAGIKVGKNPLQFYLVTDNIIGLFNPYAVHNINLRFGLQLNFGCNRKAKSKFKSCGCSYITRSEEHNEKLRKLVKKKPKDY